MTWGGISKTESSSPPRRTIKRKDHLRVHNDYRDNSPGVKLLMTLTSFLQYTPALPDLTLGSLLPNTFLCEYSLPSYTTHSTTPRTPFPVSGHIGLKT